MSEARKLQPNQVRMHRNINGHYNTYIVIYDPETQTLKAIFFRTKEDSPMMVGTFKPREDDPVVMENINTLSSLFRDKVNELLQQG